MISGRKNWRGRLKQAINNNENYIWFHCASLGEFEQGRPLIERYKKEYPNYKIVLSFFSPSGYEIRKDYQYADIVCYIPFDTKVNAKDFINIIKPKFAVFVKYEFWYYMLMELQKQEISSFLISGIFRQNQVFFRKIGKSYLQCIKSFSHLFLQDNASAELLAKYEIHGATVCGDTRIDRVVQIAAEEYNNLFLKEFSSNSKTIVCGSTWPEDEKYICQFINKSDDIRFIIAPHEINEQHLKNIESGINSSVCRLSQVENKNPSDYKVVLIDSIGILSKVYRYGDIAYVGGGFGKGIHNILEPAVYRMPIVFGPQYSSFKEAVDLINRKGAFKISGLIDLESIVNMLINDAELAENSRISTKQYISESFGASQQIFEKMQIIVK